MHAKTQHTSTRTDQAYKAAENHNAGRACGNLDRQTQAQMKNAGHSLSAKYQTQVCTDKMVIGTCYMRSAAVAATQ